MLKDGLKIFLIGFMGCGKSLIGRTLAYSLDLPFYDQDRLIEEKLDKKIPIIFDQYGESYFRDKEYQVLIELSQRDLGVFSGGGGVVTQGRSRFLIKKNFKVLFLDVSPELLWDRVKMSDRPLVQQGKSFFMNLFYERYALYRSLKDEDVVIRSFDDPWSIVNRIREKMDVS